LRKSIYGLKQAARSWNQKLNDLLISTGFKRGEADRCLYSKNVNGTFIYVLVYVDDLIIASQSEILINETASVFSKNFKIHCLGNLKCYLGIQVERDENGIFSLTQELYINKVLQMFGLEEAKPSKIPLDPGYMKQVTKSPQLSNNVSYQKAIGSLLYISNNTRPDIAASVSILSRKNSCPTQADWVEVKRVLRYLKGTQFYKLQLGNPKENNSLIGYADADWAGDVVDRKSNTGYVFKYKGSVINWVSRKQQCVTLSSTEAEYVAVANACQEAIWLQNLLTDFCEPQIKPIVINEDNQSCIKLVNNEKLNSRTKHIDVKVHFVKELANKGEIMIQYCPSECMLADILTKPLQAVKIREFCKLFNLG
jgi:hypothetical protein